MHGARRSAECVAAAAYAGRGVLVHGRADSRVLRVCCTVHRGTLVEHHHVGAGDGRVRRGVDRPRHRVSLAARLVPGRAGRRATTGDGQHHQHRDGQRDEPRRDRDPGVRVADGAGAVRLAGRRRVRVFAGDDALGMVRGRPIGAHALRVAETSSGVAVLDGHDAGRGDGDPAAATRQGDSEQNVESRAVRSVHAGGARRKQSECAAAAAVQHDLSAHDRTRGHRAKRTVGGFLRLGHATARVRVVPIGGDRVVLRV